MVENNQVVVSSVMEDMVDLGFISTFRPYFRQSDSDMDFVNNFDKQLRKLICSEDWNNISVFTKIHFIKALMVKYMRNF